MAKALNIASLLNSSGLLDSDDIAADAITAEKLNIGQVGGRRNIIINGAMQVAQRGTSETGITSYGYYTADRFETTVINLGTWTQTQETDAPDGFASSLKLECTTADASPAAGDAMLIGQKIEGQNLQHLKKGTSSAESVTASFWVKSNKTGTYIFELLDHDNSARHIGKSFTVNSSGTWEYKTITFEGDTTGALDNDNELSLQASIWLGGGSDYTGGSALQTSWGVLDHPSRAYGNVNLADTIGNYIQLTGFQLELGETATPFEHRSYAEELSLCYRYYQKFPSSSAVTPMFTGTGLDTTRVRALATPFGGLMRDVPAITLPTTTLLRGNGDSIAVTSVDAGFQIGAGYSFVFNAASGLLGNHVYYVIGATASDALELSIEL